MINRWITEKLKQSVQHSPAVALLGARQVGKTTLAQAIAHDRSSIYLDLESPEDLVKLSDPTGFLSLHDDKLVILDEIQRAPDLFMVLRGLIDKNRQAGRKGEQFLLLGSASMDLMRQSSESLAGRISYIEMAPRILNGNRARAYFAWTQPIMLTGSSNSYSSFSISRAILVAMRRSPAR